MHIYLYIRTLVEPALALRVNAEVQAKHRRDAEHQEEHQPNDREVDTGDSCHDDRECLEPGPRHRPAVRTRENQGEDGVEEYEDESKRVDRWT